MGFFGPRNPLTREERKALREEKKAAKQKAKKERSKQRERSGLVTLMTNGEWDEVRRVLTPSDDPLLGVLPWRALNECTDFTGQTALHMALKNRADLNIVELIVDTNPSYVFTTDCMGQAPLHVAAFQGVDSLVTRLLIEIAPNLAAEADCNGQMPLHLACQCLALPATEDKPALKDIQRSIRMLVQAFPKALNHEDKRGNTPLDYARESSDADSSLIDVISKVKNNKFRGPRRKSDDWSDDGSMDTQDQLNEILGMGIGERALPPVDKICFPSNW
eukprot:CAMPEP_0118715786 /NCGR_PEP_ID=MMETSP0800-20121206/27098_1 /TAXON_ID=210618 ORGANISM="Striatella unipunctata, Strain CCMP2910" /NCGR_SAMPLE_ID=MMETSP0800 /ASSEMBLY_ACC=CAM_ASM_000638 /LENGTH=275 /DNA_ID=CAMNT_0006622053 /DNA_START=154 /DNA_END=978 /DNA_ORIENTATION=-